MKKIIKAILPHGIICLYQRLKQRYTKLDIHINTTYLGTAYGGFSIAIEKLPKNPIVYSFGVGEDISFDIALIKKFNAVVYAFDPTPKSIEWLKKSPPPRKFSFLSNRN